MRHPRLTEHAFRRLLVWLDGGVDSHGDTYLEMRQRLVAYFDRRNCRAPDELADETFNRVASTLEQSGVIAVMPPARYCYVVAKFVFLEDVRRRDSAHVSGAKSSGSLVPTSRGEGEADAFALHEQRLECLDRCLNALEPAQRDLIVEYHRGVGRETIDARRALAARLDITVHALSSRASRIRDRLERCVAKCRHVSSQDRDHDA